MDFYAYRLPGEVKSVCIKAEDIAEGIKLCDGFVVCPFDTSVHPTLTIRKGETLQRLPESVPNDRPEFFPERSTTREERKREIEAIIESIVESGESERRKTVSAKVSIKQGEFNPDKIFCRLCERYPEAFVFCFHTRQTGLWIGASPELLLQKDGGKLTTMSLAGTRRAGCEEEWDEKNVEEQRIVTEEIVKIAEQRGFKVRKGETYSRKAGNIEHICTPIEIHNDIFDNEAKTRNDNFNDLSEIAEEGFSTAVALAEELSPTPALCGYPKEESKRLIKDYENFDRGYYGGFVGPITSNGDFRFMVNLRSGCFSGEEVALYAGGGITHLSEEDEEWEETEKKLRTLESHIY